MKPKYVILPPGEFYKLNHDLSELEGFDLSKNTQRYFPMIPELAKINQVFDDEGNELSYDIVFVVKISGRLQEKHPDFWLNYELVDSYVKCEDEINTIISTGLNSEVIDWSLNHFAALKVSGEKILWFEDESRTQLSDGAVERLIELGITIISPES